MAPSPTSPLSLDQFLDGIISLFVTHQILLRDDHFLAAAFLTGAFFAAGFAAFLAGALFLAAFGASSSSSRGPATTFSFFAPGPCEGLAFSGRFPVVLTTWKSSR